MGLPVPASRGGAVITLGYIHTEQLSLAWQVECSSVLCTHEMGGVAKLRGC